MNSVVILDVDGTLVDTNYQHALAWYRAFRDHDIVLPIWRLHRHIGMGGDQLVADVTNDDVEARLGDQIRESETDHYAAMMDEVEVFEGARQLLHELHDTGHRFILASSAKPNEIDFYIDLLQAREIADGWTQRWRAWALTPMTRRWWATRRGTLGPRGEPVLRRSR
jgi:beta-phosphoglucomutase-like phosphatase (HAD superfamily)